ncbi:MAG: hypothetical protein WC758_08630, partial [Candidatus Woesearchaeota archaeon]
MIITGKSYSSVLECDRQPLDKKYIMSLSESAREDLIEPLFVYFRNIGWMYPEVTIDVLAKEYKRLIDYKPDLFSTILFNNSSVATKICKYFCNSFYLSTERNKKTMEEVWNDDDLLRKLIRNRLALNWKIESSSDVFAISYRMMVQGMRSMRLVPSISIFKPDIAKYICMKYSSEGDIVGDYSAGFGGRLLGAVSCGRKYMGIDPLTVPELQQMVEFFEFKDVTLIESGSENYIGDENSLDLSFSSPPYYDQEFYSNDLTQAYNNGANYFYNTYWKKTLDNMKFMLKPGKWFGLNIKNNEMMLNMAINIFGDIVEKIEL